MELTEFLLARIAEDEEVARAASPGPWHVDTESATVLAVDDIEVCDGFALSDPQLRATTNHIARHDPARVLAECDAKRRIVEAESRWRRTKENVCAETRKAPDGWVYVRWLDEDYRPHDERVSADEFRERFTEPSPPSGTLKCLAQPYADHPDYDPAWRP